MRKLSIILIVLLFGSFYTYSNTQKLDFDHVTLDDGLSHSFVQAIFQDSKGFLWVGTVNGLNRYDGYGVKVYNNIPGETNSLPHAVINTIYEDRAGNIWIGTDGGLALYNLQADNFIVYKKSESSSNSLNHNGIRALFEDDMGNIWIGTYGGGLNRFNPSEGTFSQYSGLSHNKVEVMIPDSMIENVLWIGTSSGGVNRFDINSEEITIYKHDDSNINSLSHNSVRSIYQDYNGTIWVGTKGGINRYNRYEDNFYRYENTGNNTIRSILLDRDGVLWLGTNSDGLHLLDIKSGVVTEFHNDPENSNSVGSNTVWRMYQDRSGIIWLGTWGRGLSKYDPQKKKFYHVFTQKSNKNSLSNNTVMSFEKDSDGTLWIATRGGGLNRYDEVLDEFLHFKYDPLNDNSVSSDVLFSLMVDSDEILWIGTDNGLNRLDIKSGEIKRYLVDTNDKKALHGSGIYTILDNGDGTLWCGGWESGLTLFDKQSGTVIKRYMIEDGISNNTIFDLYRDRDDNLWVVTRDKLNILNSDTGILNIVEMDLDDPNSISSNGIGSITEDRLGNLWIATFDSGIDYYNYDTGEYTNYNSSDGLINDNVFGIVIDAEGNLWMSTLGGISYFDVKSKEFINYRSYQGTQSNEFSLGSYFKDQEGKIYMGGINGYNYFYPYEVSISDYRPEVVITDLKIFNESINVGELSLGEDILQTPISYAESLDFSYKQDFLTFEFSTLDFSSPGNIEYAYKLEGFDRAWNYTDANRRFATYTNLDPGKYHLRVIATNSDGVWNEDGVSLELNITPPFWETLPFRILVIVLIVITIVSIFNIRLRYLERSRVQLEALVERRTHDLGLAKERAEKASLEKSKSMDLLKKTQDKLIEAKTVAVLGKLISGVAHEINTPVGVGITSLSHLNDLFNGIREKYEKGQLSSSDLECYLKGFPDLYDLIYYGFNSTADLIKKLGTLRIDSEHMNLERFDTKKEIEVLIDLYQKRLDTSHVKVNINSTREVFVTNFRIIFHKVINNLMENSLDHGFKDMDSGEISIEISRNSDNQVEIIFSDNGVGISEKYIEKIFDPLFSTRRFKGNLGLGLSFSHNMITSVMNGSITYIPTENSGTTFKITLGDI